MPSSASAISPAWRRATSWSASGSRNRTVAQGSTVNPAPCARAMSISSGCKHLITNAREADLFAIFCFTEGPSRGAREFSVLLVERGMPGFTIERMAPTMGCSGASHDLLRFDNVPVPVENVGPKG